MHLTQLAKVAKRTGRPVVEVPGWKTRGHGDMGDVRTITCHHTAGPRAGNAPSLNVVINGRPGLAGPLAHYVLGRDGTIYVAAAGLCWHAGVSRSANFTNAHAVGIEAEATGVDPWPAAQVAAYAALVGELAKEFRISVGHALGHKETCAPVGRKTDPNLSMPALRQAGAAYLRPKPKPSPIKPGGTDVHVDSESHWAGKRTLKPSTLTTIPVNVNGDPSILLGLTDFDVDWEVTCLVKPGCTVQVQPVTVVPDGKTFKVARSFGAREFIGTDGSTFTGGHTMGHLASNERLRLRVVTFGDPQGGAVTRVHIRTRVWK